MGEARAAVGYITKNTKVKVVRIEGGVILLRLYKFQQPRYGFFLKSHDGGFPLYRVIFPLPSPTYPYCASTIPQSVDNTAHNGNGTAFQVCGGFFYITNRFFQVEFGASATRTGYVFGFGKHTTGSLQKRSMQKSFNASSFAKEKLVQKAWAVLSSQLSRQRRPGAHL